MKCDAVIEKIKARVAAVDANGPRKVLGVFQLNIKAADGVHKWSKFNNYINLVDSQSNLRSSPPPPNSC